MWPSAHCGTLKGRRVPTQNSLNAIRLSLEMAGAILVFRGDTALGILVIRQDGETPT